MEEANGIAFDGMFEAPTIEKACGLMPVTDAWQWESLLQETSALNRVVSGGMGQPPVEISNALPQRRGASGGSGGRGVRW